MLKPRTRPTRHVVLEYEAETALEKALVRMAQASRQGPEEFLATRVGAVFFQVVGIALFVAGVIGAAVLAAGDLSESLGFPAIYLSVCVLILSAFGALALLVTGEVLTLWVSLAQNTRLTAVLLAEMNFADRSEHTLERAARPSSPS